MSTMSKLWQVLLGLGLVLPLGGYVAGSLAATSAEDPAPRPRIVLETSPAERPLPGATLSRSPDATPGNDADNEDPDDGPDDADDADDIEVIVPQPGDLDDRDDDRDDDRNDDD